MTILTPFRLYKDLDLNFTRHPQDGDVAKVLDINSIKQALKVLILSRFGERPFQPDLGSPIFGLLFEPIDPITTEVIRQTITQVVQNHEPRVVLDTVNVVPNDEQNSYDISIYFTAVGIPLPVTFSLSLQRLR